MTDDLERTDCILVFCAIARACWRRTLFSDSKFVIFSSSLFEKDKNHIICILKCPGM